MFLGWKLRFHRRIPEFRQHEGSTEAAVVERHGLGAIAVKKKKGRTAEH
jgi:hypothetical protein